MKYVYQESIGYISLDYLCTSSQIVRSADSYNKPAIEFIKLIETHTMGCYKPTFVEDKFYILLFDTIAERDAILNSIVDAK